MAQPQLNAMLRRVRQLVRATAWATVDQRTVEELEDRRLLERFARQADGEAFAALVRRHGPMVLGVCRRALPRSHDAEDAFQATFLVLARQAGAIRRPEALGAWLYEVAQHLAARVRLADQRRRTRERHVAAPEAQFQAEPVDCDLPSIIDAELHRLPAKYRAPLVLCYLQNKTYTEAAQELGWAAGTVSGRLARARDLLRSRLLRRGVAVSAAGLTPLLTEAAAASAVPVALLASTARLAGLSASGAAVAGLISAQVAALRDGMAKTLLLAKLKLAAAVLLALGCLALGASMIGYRVLASGAGSAGRPLEEQKPKRAGQTQHETKNQQAASRQRAADPSDPLGQRLLSAAGTVVDRQGKPIAGAKVYVLEWHSARWSRNPDKSVFNAANDNDILASTATDAQGRFALKDILAPGSDHNWLCPWDLLVLAQGHALAWRRLTPENRQQALTLQLEAEEQIHGRVVDEAGKPVKGAQVRVAEVSPLHHPLDRSNSSPARLFLNWSRVPLSATSDADGQFRIAGLPAQVRVGLYISHEEHQWQGTYAATTDQPQAKLVERYSGPEPGKVRENETPVHTKKFTIALKPAVRLHGQVLFEDTGKPAAGCGIVLWQGASSRQGKTDANGRYSIGQIPFEKWNLALYPPAGAPYVGLRTELDLSRAERQVEQNFRLEPGTPVSGRIVDEETGKGVAGALVAFHPETKESRQLAASVHSEPDGRFRIAVPAGAGRLFVAGEVPGYLTERRGWKPEELDARFVRALNVAPNQSPPDVEFKLSPGRLISGTVVDDAGKPVARARVIPFGRQQQQREGLGVRQTTYTDEAGKFTLGGLRDDAELALYVLERERRLGIVLPVELKPGKRIDLPPIALPRLGTTTGRVVGEDGKPIGGVLVRGRTHTDVGPGMRYDGLEENVAVTDAQGQFTLAHLVPGCRYSLLLLAGGCLQADSEEFTAPAKAIVSLGQIKLLKADQSIAGVLLDEAGKPVAGAYLSVFLAEHRPRGNRVWLDPDRYQTDGEGRFKITGLSRGSFQLAVHIPPGDSQNLFPVEAGQQDLRLVFKPNPER